MIETNIYIYILKLTQFCQKRARCVFGSLFVSLFVFSINKYNFGFLTIIMGMSLSCGRFEIDSHQGTSGILFFTNYFRRRYNR